MEPPFEGLSFEELTSKILNTGEPPPLVPGVTYHDLRFMQDACTYSILDLIPKVKKLTAGIQGLDIMLLSESEETDEPKGVREHNTILSCAPFAY